MSQITTWDEFPTVEYVKGVLPPDRVRREGHDDPHRLPGGVVIPEHSHEAEQIMLVVPGRLWAKVADEEKEVGPGSHPGHPVQLGPRLPPAGRRGRRVLRVLRADPAGVPRGLQGAGSVARDDAQAVRRDRRVGPEGLAVDGAAGRSRPARRSGPPGPRAGTSSRSARSCCASTRARAASRTTRTFTAWEGGGEYNVARGLRALLRPAHGGRHRARRQPGRPAGRGPHPAGRRGPVATSAGSRTTASAARCATGSTSRSAGSASGPRSAAPTAATRRPRSCGRATSTGTRSSASEGVALVPHRRHLRRRSPRRRRRSPARRWRPRAATARSSPTTSTTGPRCGRRSAGQARAQEVNRELVGARRRACSATRRTSRPRSASRSRALDASLSALDPAQLRADDRAGRRGATRTSRVVATTLRDGADRDPQRLGRDLLGGRRAATRPRRGADLEILDRVGGGDSFASGPDLRASSRASARRRRSSTAPRTAPSR